MNPEQLQAIFRRIHDEVGRAFVGQDTVVNAVLVALFARGHVLLEGVPGLGKTLLVRTLAQILGCKMKRVQFTPDLMPSDVTGSTLYNAQKGEFAFKQGPIFTELLLADEVNRAPAKTQSAMLEAMAERSVSVDGQSYPLPDPFFVLATQNPLESAGTYPLPEAQLDRFLMKLIIEHPSHAVETELLQKVRDGFDAADLRSVELETLLRPADILAIRRFIETIRVDDSLIDYILRLVEASRRHGAVQVGASPRAGIALLRAARVQAAIEGRDYVIPDDVKRHVLAVLRHRLILQPDAELEGLTSDALIQSLLTKVEVPSGYASDAASTQGRSLSF